MSHPVVSESRQNSFKGVGRWYAVPFLGSIGGTFLTLGIFFYTSHRLGWGLRRNFLLAAAQGVIYIFGALSADRIAKKLTPWRALASSHLAMAIVAGVGALATDRVNVPLIVAATLLYTCLSAMAWPVIEAMVCQGADAEVLSRRITIYNIVWSGSGAVALAISGTLIESSRSGIMLVAAASHIVCAAWVAWSGSTSAAVASQPVASHIALAVEPELLRLRTTALWLSRLSLPATYGVAYGLMPLMPLLPVMARLNTHTQTIVGSTWLVTRWLAFAFMAMGTWWHRRPRILLLASAAMLAAFIGITLRPSQFWAMGAAGPTIDLASSIAWQAMLGLSVGAIYCGSLYFGMVLSQGSTEHGGYHEALIGLGWVLGPVAGAAAGTWKPGDVGVGVSAIGWLIGASVFATAIAAVIAARRK